MPLGASFEARSLIEDAHLCLAAWPNADHNRRSTTTPLFYKSSDCSPSLLHLTFVVQSVTPFLYFKVIREGEQALQGQMGGSNQGDMGGGSSNMNQQSGGGQSSGGGGFMSGLEKTGENAMIDQGTSSPLQLDTGSDSPLRQALLTPLSAEVNQFATKEGVPAAMDPVIDQFVNREV